jgi:ubiquinone/menaquinone biosynthesis C-methylase UbiE
VNADAGEFTSAVARAYDGTGGAWSDGPALVYDRLAAVLVELSPIPLSGRTVVDAGAGTGAASLAIGAVGGTVVAVDLSSAMLGANRAAVAGAAVGDVAALPLGSRSVGGLVAAFSLNHLADPARGFAEAARVCRPGSPVLAAAYADDDTHPAKDAVERAAQEHGWTPEPWYVALRTTVSTQLATPAGMAAAAEAGGLSGGTCRRVAVDLPGLTVAEVIGWRMGMAQIAPFLAAGGGDARARIAARAADLLGPAPPPLQRSIVAYCGTT